MIKQRCRWKLQATRIGIVSARNLSCCFSSYPLWLGNWFLYSFPCWRISLSLDIFHYLLIVPLLDELCLFHTYLLLHMCLSLLKISLTKKWSQANNVSCSMLSSTSFLLGYQNTKYFFGFISFVNGKLKEVEYCCKFIIEDISCFWQAVNI